jgi:hypothetical protein
MEEEKHTHTMNNSMSSRNQSGKERSRRLFHIKPATWTG